MRFDDEGRVFIDDTDVTASIRKPGIDQLVPVVARHPAVREVMRERQRTLGEEGDVVIEGRDIGTVVAPQAGVKVYLSPITTCAPGAAPQSIPSSAADALATDLRLRDERDAVNMQPARRMRSRSTRPTSPSTRSWSGSSALVRASTGA